MLALATVAAAILDIAHLRGVATGEHLAHELIVLRRLRAPMGRLKRLPGIGKDVLQDPPGL
jgi:hypothetical protein